MTGAVPTGSRPWGRRRCRLTSPHNAPPPTSVCAAWLVAGVSHDLAGWGGAARFPAAPLVPEGVAVALRRGVRGTPDRRCLRTPAFADPHRGCGAGGGRGAAA